MQRLTGIVATTILLLGALAMPALAADYPPRPGPVVDPDVTIATPCTTITIQGTSWGPGTVIEIEQEDRPACAPGQADNEDNDNDDDNDAGGASTSGASTSGAVTSVRADANGAFTAEVQVPAGSDTGDVTYTARGVDAEGNTETREIVVALDDEAASATIGGATTAGGAQTAGTFWTVGNSALIALVIVGAGLLLIGPVRRRVGASS